MKKISDSFCDKMLIASSIVFCISSILLCINFRGGIIVGGSMSPTLLDGEFKLFYKNYEEINRYDIVYINNSESRLSKDDLKTMNALVKRVIGIPGDTIDVVNGHVYINGELDKYDVEGTENDLYYRSAFSITLGDDEYFVCGDNRLNSYDNRKRGFGGPVKASEIEAILMFQ